jgi:pyruvate-ferredoxin/flavodoxin oxidoreductase
VPFVNFFDGFRTSHEISKIEVMDYKDYAKMLDWDAVKGFPSERLEP